MPRDRKPTAVNKSTVKEVSPLAKQNQIVRPPKTDTTEMHSNVTVLPVKANLDRRTSQSAESLRSSTESQEFTVPTPLSSSVPKPFTTFPAQKTMADALVGASSGQKPSNTSPTNEKPTSKVSTSTLFPTKEHAFLLQSVDTISIHQYLRAVADVVGAKNIWFGSRLSLGRVAIYLRTAAQVDDFMESHGGVDLGNEFLPARRLITKATRLVLSNVCPTIPHVVLEKMLSSAVKLVSPMTFVNVGGKDPELSSVLSFRRQIFVVIEQTCQLPESILVEHDGDKYRVFLSFDDLRCFVCRKTGHLAKHCKETQAPEGNVHSTDRNSDSEAPPELNTTSKRKDPPSSVSVSGSTAGTSVDAVESTVPVVVVDSPAKINMEKDLEETIQNAENQQKNKIEQKRTDKNKIEEIERSSKNVKRRRTQEPISLPLEAQELLARNEAVNALSISDFNHFLQDVKGNDHPLRVVKKYTQDVSGVVTMLELIQPKLITERAIRERVRRLVANLKKIIMAASDDEDNVSIARSTSCESMSSVFFD